MKEYEMDTDDVGLGFMSSYEDYDVEIIKEYQSDTMQKFYRVKVKDYTDGSDNI
tara:strand:- start:897 stop:1058 length:162 start_codon:yes stop_codon:yes gene_type:complete